MPQEMAEPRSLSQSWAFLDKKGMAALRRLVSIPKNTVSMIGVNQQQETQIRAKVTSGNNSTL
jgi:hypothetical protein